MRSTRSSSRLEFSDSLDTELTRATASTYDNMVLCIDANARVGSHTSTAIGPCCPAMESENGMIFGSTLETHGLLAVNTFMGGFPTWSPLDICHELITSASHSLHSDLLHAAWPTTTSTCLLELAMIIRLSWLR